MNKLKIIAFTHKFSDVSDIGKLHIEDSFQKVILSNIKSLLGIEELLYLSTCNRVEFILVTSNVIDNKFIYKFFHLLNPDFTENEKEWAVLKHQLFQGEEALQHLYNVASSIDSMVVGEREIITQVRTAYDKCKEFGLTGDLIRLVIKHTIEVAKEIYTETDIARNPVSVVSLAYRKLKELNVKLDSRFLIIGAGITNSTMVKYLKKHQFSNFTIFNRTIENAKELAAELDSKAYSLNELSTFKEGFDIIVTCTGSSESIITPSIYKSLVGKDTAKKIVIDLAIPNDLDLEIVSNYDVNLIAINNLQEIAKENLKAREKELEFCDRIIKENIETFKQVLKTRKVEVAMREVPRKVKEIREIAVNEVFAKELSLMDIQSKEVLNKILSYIENKYISVPMKMAKEILTNQN